MASWDVFSVILMLVSLRNLGIEVEKPLVYRVDLHEIVKLIVNELRNVFSIIFMLVVDICSILKEIIGVFFVILDVGVLIW